MNILFLDCTWGITEKALLEALTNFPEPPPVGLTADFYAEREAKLIKRLSPNQKKLYAGEVWGKIKDLLGRLQIAEIYYTPLPLAQALADWGQSLEGLSLRPGGGGEFTALMLIWLASWAEPDLAKLNFKLKALAWGKLKKDLVLPVAWGIRPSERIKVLETAIDDQNPQIWSYLLPKLLREGAVDVYLTAIQMKKNRPGQLLTVLVQEDQEEKIADLILQETTTLGLRIREESRIILQRSFEELNTPWGRVRIKKAFASFGSKWHPEYEDCRQIAEKQNWPLLRVYREIDRLIQQKY